MSRISSVLLPTNEYLGVLWTLTGVKDVAVINHGTAGCNFFEFATASKKTRQLIYDRFCTTGIEQEDIALNGGEDKLKEVIEEMAAKQNISLVAIVANPVSSLIGVDIEAIAKEVEKNIRLPILTFDNNVWNENAENGIEEALLKLVELYCPKQLDNQYSLEGTFSVNIIGPTVNSFNWSADEKELIRLFSFIGIKVRTVLTYETTTEEIKKLPSANLNIVTRAAGIKTARYLEKYFETPYLYSLPYGLNGTLQWLRKVAEFANQQLPKELIEKEMAFPLHHYLELISGGIFYQKEWTVVLACSPVMAKGIIQMVKDDWNFPLKAVRLTTAPQANELEEIQSLGVQVYVTPNELEWRKVLKEIQPFILMGSAEDSLLAKDVPIHLRIVEPAYDTFSFFEGNPLVGWEGFKCITQQLFNEISRYSLKK